MHLYSSYGHALERISGQSSDDEWVELWAGMAQYAPSLATEVIPIQLNPSTKGDLMRVFKFEFNTSTWPKSLYIQYAAISLTGDDKPAPQGWDVHFPLYVRI